VHKLRDFPAAENYCLINTSETDVAERARLFHMLLSVYLDPNNESASSAFLSLVFLLINDCTVNALAEQDLILVG